MPSRLLGDDSVALIVSFLEEMAALATGVGSWPSSSVSVSDSSDPLPIIFLFFDLVVFILCVMYCFSKYS